MIGLGSDRKLVIDRASKAIGYFLYPIFHLYEVGGSLTREQLQIDIAIYAGDDPNKKSKDEVRTQYNKTNFPRYYGFADVDFSHGEEMLILTPRGRIAAQMIDSSLLSDRNIKPDDRLSIKEDCKAAFRDLLLESMFFDSFGRGNSGVKSSRSDVNPPNVLLNLVARLASVTSVEAVFAIYGLHRGVFSSFEKAVDDIVQKRNNHPQDLGWSEMVQFIGNKAHGAGVWELSDLSASDDFKLGGFFCNAGLLKEQENGLGQKVYVFSSDLTDDQISRIACLPIFHRPHQLVMHGKQTGDWVRSAALGAVADDGRIFEFDAKKEGKGSFVEVLRKALVCSFRPQKGSRFLLVDRATYLVVHNCDLNLLESLMGEYAVLLERITDTADPYNGWSANETVWPEAYAEIAHNADGIGPQFELFSDIVSKDAVRFPPNLHFICEVNS